MGRARTWGYTSGIAGLAISLLELVGFGGSEEELEEEGGVAPEDPAGGGDDELGDRVEDEEDALTSSTLFRSAVAAARASAVLELSASSAPSTFFTSSSPSVRSAPSSDAGFTHRLSFCSELVLCMARIEAKVAADSCLLGDDASLSLSRGRREAMLMERVVEADEEANALVGRHDRYGPDRIAERTGSICAVDRFTPIDTR